MKIKLLLIQKKIADQRAHVATNLVNLKQIEVSVSGAMNLQRILYDTSQKHEWILPQSDVFYKQLESLSKVDCELCSQQFNSFEQMTTHIILII